ncbi:MAG: endonuclease domain-containing protein [Devosia sp.]
MGKELRRKLRAQPSVAEIRFWRLVFSLRTGGWHFRKQVQLGAYYVDFACLHAGVVVEIDGDTHGTERVERNDETRGRYLRERGFVVLRFSNENVLSNPDGVYETLLEALDRRPGNLRGGPPPQPSPQGGGCRAGEIGEIAVQQQGGGGPAAEAG